jgi:hypothetical protein
MSHYDKMYRRGGSSPAHSPPQPHATPGKQTLVQTQLADAAPIQRQSTAGGSTAPAFDPASVQVDQYAPGTDLQRFNDCGPAVVLMIVRAMGQEAALRQVIAKSSKPPVDVGTLTLQQELTYIRGKVAITDEKPAAGADRPLSFGEVQSALSQVLADLKIKLTDEQLRAKIVAIGDPSQAGYLTTNSDQPADPWSPTRVQQFLTDHCGGGSAVIALGLPTGAAWGWGGDLDPSRRQTKNDQGVMAPQTITENGNHFVLVWSDASGVYTVLDPSWSAPQHNISLERIVAFLAAKGGGTQVDLLAVPYADLATYVPAPIVPTGKPKQPLQTKAAPGGSAPGADPGTTAGSGERLPIQTQHRMERLFGRDLSTLRVFQDDRAAAVGANAFAQGTELHFAPGQYQPGTGTGDRLIGHEIAHVAQQQQGRVATPTGASAVVDHPGLEAEADQLGDRAAAGEVVDGSGDVVPALATSDRDHDHAAQRQPSGDGGPVPEPGPIGAQPLQDVIDAFEQAAAAAHPKAAAIRQPAVAALWASCQTDIPKQADLHTYAQSTVADANKREQLGKIAARRARLEFLIGWLVPGGLHDTGKNLENGPGQTAEDPTGKVDKSSNAGTIVSRYTDAYGATNHDWCGQFVGYCLGETGMPVLAPGQASDHYSLLSAYGANQWIENPSRVHGAQEVIMTPANLLDGSAVPQAGDVIVWKLHIAMVEACADGVISTIEGNISVFPHDYANGIGGSNDRVADLVNLHGGLYCIWRPGLQAMGATSTPDAAATTHDPVGDALVDTVEGACRQVGALYSALNLPGAGAIANHQNVADMVHDAQPTKK